MGYLLWGGDGEEKLSNLLLYLSDYDYEEVSFQADRENWYLLVYVKERKDGRSRTIA